MDGVAYNCAFYTVPYPMAHSTGLPVSSLAPCSGRLVDRVKSVFGHNP